MKKKLFDFYLASTFIVNTLVIALYFGLAILAINKYGIDTPIALIMAIILLAITYFLAKKFIFNLEYPKNEYGNPDLEKMVDLKSPDYKFEGENLWGYISNENGTCDIFYVTGTSEDGSGFDYELEFPAVDLYDVIYK